MPDTTKPSWACDWCGKERFKGDCGFDARYMVKIESPGGYASIFGCHIKEDKYVCCDCISKLEKDNFGFDNTITKSRLMKGVSMEQNDYLSLLWIRYKPAGGGCILKGKEGEFILIKPDWTVEKYKDFAEARGAVDKT